jgi:5-formyltetrahydrofolate cyclo-ligase
MTDIRQLKKDVRMAALTRRDALDVDIRQAQSFQIKTHFSDLELEQDTIISAFLPIRSEVDLRPVMSDLLAVGMNVCLPSMLDGQTIEFRQYLSDTQLVDNGFGTLAPADGSAVLDPGLMLIPLSAYDASGGRIGYGAGFYDRAIDQLFKQDKNPLLIGVAFSVQEVDQVPVEDHDVPLDMVLTEHGLLITQ